jgi:hypothetical protein
VTQVTRGISQFAALSRHQNKTAVCHRYPEQIRTGISLRQGRKVFHAHPHFAPSSALALHGLHIGGTPRRDRHHRRPGGAAPPLDPGRPLQNHHSARNMFPVGVVQDKYPFSGSDPVYGGWTHDILPYAENQQLKSLYNPSATTPPTPVTTTAGTALAQVTRFRE